MKVRTKLALGCVLAALPLALGMVYAVDQTKKLAEQSARSTAAQHHTVELSLQILRGLEQIGELQRKGRVTEDDDYRLRAADLARDVDGWIVQLQSTPSTDAERRATQRLTDAWAASPRLEPAREAVGQLLAASRGAIAEHAAWSEARRKQVERVAFLVGGGALLFSALAIWSLVLAIQRPVAQLIDGTRNVAAGRFDFRAAPLADDELGEVTRAFNQMVDSLGELERMKAELISKVSHELRTPLVAMVETNQLLLDEIPGPINSRQRRMLELHAGAASRLAAMIRNLLDLSALEAGDELRLEMVDLVALTRDVVEQLDPLAEERKVALEMGATAEVARVRCDRRRYQHIVQNLVDNAVKHSPRGGYVHIGLRIMAADAVPDVLQPAPGDRYVLLSVDDEGPGVAPPEREEIFGIFVQGSSKTPRGVGRGLAICRLR
ncbi:MAG: HAMP domain-containing sensor histidine kinase [Myxococcota bacterium]